MPPGRWRSQPADGWEAPGFDDSGWAAAREVGRPPVAPWGALSMPELGPLAPCSVVRRDVPNTVRAGGRLRRRRHLPHKGRWPGGRRAPGRRGELAAGARGRVAGEATGRRSSTIGPAEVTLPAFPPGGKARLRLGPAGSEVVGRSREQCETAEITVLPRKPGPLARRGAPPSRDSTLFINGRPDTGMNYIHNRDVPFHGRTSRAPACSSSSSSRGTSAGWDRTSMRLLCRRPDDPLRASQLPGCLHHPHL